MFINEEGRTRVVFGDGVVGVNHTVVVNQTLFNTCGLGKLTLGKLSRPYPIGTIDADKANPEDLRTNPLVTLEFRNIESLDVVLSGLNKIRANMLEVKAMSDAEMFKYGC